MIFRLIREYPLHRFLKRQEKMYGIALQELRSGLKHHHWMWYIFPQLRGLARSRKAFVFGIVNLREARAYLAHPILGSRLITCCEAILTHADRPPEEILGALDAVKLRSCATLFSLVSEKDSVFHAVLDRFYDGKPDPLTLGLADGSIKDETYKKYLVAVDF